MDAPINSRNRALADRLLEKIEYDTAGGCWLLASLRVDHDGYGTMKYEGKAQMRRLHAQGISQASIARQFGCSPGHVSIVVRYLMRP